MLAGAIFVSSGARGSSRKEDLRPPSSSDTSTQLHSGSCSTRPQADRIRGCGSVIPWHKNIMCDIMLWTSTSPTQRVAVIHQKSVCIKQHRRSCFNFIATASCFFFVCLGFFWGDRKTQTHTHHYPHLNQREDSRSHPQHPIVSDCGLSEVENVRVGEDEAHRKNPAPGLISSQAHRSNESRWSQSRGLVMWKLQHQIHMMNTRSTLGFLIILSYLNHLCYFLSWVHQTIYF